MSNIADREHQRSMRLTTAKVSISRIAIAFVLVLAIVPDVIFPHGLQR
ncbi:MAG: hypothetical protein IPP33_18045 [Flavobacteriales bacterium]|nr:hypothetical protein [Flavobacteriales bacterium]